jgi:hypothetical protein
MKKSNKPTKKLALDPDLFNALYATLLYFIGTEATFGETEYSRDATNLKEQIDKYGRFIEATNPDDSTFIIYYFDKEVMQILRIFTMFTAMKLSTAVDYFTQLARRKKSKM